MSRGCVKQYKSHTASVRDGHIFSNRVINVWNSLPGTVVSSAIVTGFKLKLKSLNFSLDWLFLLLTLLCNVRGSIYQSRSPALMSRSTHFPFSYFTYILLKPSFHYPSWRPELTTRVNGPSWRVTGFHYPSSRAVLTGARFHYSRVEHLIINVSTRVVETGLNCLIIHHLFMLCFHVVLSNKLIWFDLIWYVCVQLQVSTWKWTTRRPPTCATCTDDIDSCWPMSTWRS